MKLEDIVEIVPKMSHTQNKVISLSKYTKRGHLHTHTQYIGVQEERGGGAHAHTNSVSHSPSHVYNRFTATWVTHRQFEVTLRAPPPLADINKTEKAEEHTRAHGKGFRLRA